MAEPQTLSHLLAAQGERKLVQLRDGISAEIKRLTLELQLVEEALERKRRAKRPDLVSGDGKTAIEFKSAPRRSGGLSRDQLFVYLYDAAQPMSAAEMQRYLAERGIEKTVEAVRVALSRLEKDNRVFREHGKFAVPSGAKVEPGDPLFREPGLDTEGVATPDE